MEVVIREKRASLMLCAINYHRESFIVHACDEKSGQTFVFEIFEERRKLRQRQKLN